ncbi:MAG: CRISPR-associated protein Cas4 [Akkermansiaceae bacterium]|nr:CRISPR-associated protein Cas4 [Akkermansiaceae bacterium]
MFTEDQLLPLSALQHYLFCPRQCALIHLEQAWAENRFTAEGRVLHEKAHGGPDESRAGVRIVRALPVRSLVLGISGECDVVEFSACGGDLKFEISDLKGRAADTGNDSPAGHLKSQISNLKSTTQAVPVEYKRGKPKSHRADEVQVCAQAICLEEMLGLEIPYGRLYYGEKRRRTEVAFDAELRDLVRVTAASLHQMIASRQTPAAEYSRKKCGSRSLVEICLPAATRHNRRSASDWFRASLRESQI